MTKWICSAMTAAFVLVSQVAHAETLSCGLKEVTVQDGRIHSIRHEDGTIHRGEAVSTNWEYDGKSIKHRLMKKPIPCDSAPMTRDEVVAELSSRFEKNPGLYNMDPQEGRWMTDYTRRLMTSGKDCHLLVDAAKSVERRGMFYIDCNDTSGRTHRHWISRDDLRSDAHP